MSVVQVLPFTIDGNRLAIGIDNVHRVLPRLKVTLLPDAPAVVLGLVTVHGKVLPVIDLARRFGWASPLNTFWQPFIWVRSSRRELLLASDTVAPVLHCTPESFVATPDPAVPSEALKGVVRSDAGLLLIQDVERLLSLDDEAALGDALHRHGRGTHGAT